MDNQFRQRVMDYKSIFTTEAGMRVLEDLGNYGFISQTTYDDSAHRMVFREGARDVVLYIRKLIEYKFDEEQQDATEEQEEG